MRKVCNQRVFSASTPSESTPYFTIFIPTYNRIYTLPRALNSISSQTFRDFDVLIVDDGSTDNTRSLITSWSLTQPFPVYYVYQPNQGKHCAHNTALHHIRGKMTVILDSDDTLAPDALERLHYYWLTIPASERHHYAGVEGLCATLKDGTILGTPYPEDVMDSNYIDIHRRFGVDGDKKNAIVTRVLQQYPFPCFEGERDVRPSLIWKRIARHYKFRYFNEVVQFVEYQPDGLSSNPFHIRMASPKGFCLYFLEEINLHGHSLSIKELIRAYSRYVRYALHAGYPLRHQITEVNSPLWLALIYPSAWLHYHADRLRLKKHTSLR